MAEYIDKKILMNDMGMAQGCKMSCADCEKINCNIGEIIDRQPLIELEPVKHGEWIADDYECNHCSECGYEHDVPEYVTPYCPGCGAKMEGEK